MGPRISSRGRNLTYRCKTCEEEGINGGLQRIPISKVMGRIMGAALNCKHGHGPITLFKEAPKNKGAGKNKARWIITRTLEGESTLFRKVKVN